MPPPSRGAPSPRGANRATAGVLVGFVVGVFFYCTRAVGSQNQISPDELEDFKAKQHSMSFSSERKEPIWPWLISANARLLS
tara:strand:- start:44 stop:289 length:246 start_codon:yes stop_codon:yes gene_type:complete